MKKVITAAVLIAALCSLTSCDAFKMIKSNPSAIRNYFISDETYADTEMESYYDSVEELSGDTADLTGETDAILSGLTELHGELEIYTFPNAEAALVYNDTDAYIIDYTLGRAENICDYDAMLAVADPTGRGSEYFKNTSLEIEVSDRARESQIIFTVTDGDAYYKVYGFYTFDPISGGTRGFRGYYGDSINYPGAYDPATIYDVKDFAALGVTGIEYLYERAAAIATGDFEALSEMMYLTPEVAEKWKTVKIGEYSISRTDFSPNWPPSLIVYIDVIESGHEGLPVGKYNVTVSDGYDNANIRIERLDGEPFYADYDTSDINTPIGFAYQYAKSFGGSYHPDEQNTDNSSWAHCILDFYSFITSHSERVGDYEDFERFCLYRFAVEDASTVCDVKSFYNHGGHGLSSVSCAVSDYTSASGVHIVTIDFFADPMRTVVAYTHVFTVVENDELELYKVERSYDSGLSAV